MAERTVLLKESPLAAGTDAGVGRSDKEGSYFGPVRELETLSKLLQKQVLTS
jgi:hypothetical protein